MANQLGAVRFTGKLANVVGYKNSASNKNNNHFVRERVYTISNPRTYAQAKQRSKARPAQIFYEAFSPVENHAFLPKDRASKNRNKFLSLAMKLDEISDVMKGQAFLPFCRYQISKGALGLDSLCKGESLNTAEAGISDYADCVKFPNLNTGTTADVIAGTTTIAELSEDILTNNIQLVEGEEVTILAVMCLKISIYERFAVRASFVLDKGNVITQLADVLPAALTIYGGTDGALIVAPGDSDYSILSCGVIISSKTDTSWVYTNSFMAKSGFAIDGFDWDEELVIESYMTEGSTNASDLILQQANNAMAGNRVVVNAVENETFELATGVTGTTSESDAAIATYTDGNRKVVVLNEGMQLVNLEDGVFTPLTITGTGQGAQPEPLKLTDTKWAGNDYVLASELGTWGSF